MARLIWTHFRFSDQKCAFPERTSHQQPFCATFETEMETITYKQYIESFNLKTLFHKDVFITKKIWLHCPSLSSLCTKIVTLRWLLACCSCWRQIQTLDASLQSQKWISPAQNPHSTKTLQTLQARVLSLSAQGCLQI